MQIKLKHYDFQKIDSKKTMDYILTELKRSFISKENMENRLMIYLLDIAKDLKCKVYQDRYNYAENTEVYTFDFC